MGGNHLHIKVRRNEVFVDSFRSLRYKSAEELKKKLSVEFSNEDGACRLITLIIALEIYVNIFYVFYGLTESFLSLYIDICNSGMDAGGLTREWFSVLAKEIFNPNYALFNGINDNDITFQPNPQSDVNPEHLTYFKFVGRVIGKAIFDNHLFDAHFTRSFYKHILGTLFLIS